jgi:uncharacterized membrane protein YbhN (UPF0104 family)
MIGEESVRRRIRRTRPKRARDVCPRRTDARALPTKGARSETVPRSAPAAAMVTIRRRLAGAVVLATATATIVLAVPPLRGVARQIGHMEPAWVALAAAAEIASCLGYVVIFRLFFDAVPAGIARELAWTEEASGALLPTGGVGALAIGGWMLRRAGMSTRTIIERSSALFFLTSGVNVAALVGGGVMLSTGVLGGRETVLLVGLPIGLGVISTLATLAVPVVLRRAPQRAWPPWLVDLAAGIDGARHALLRPHWRLLGAIGYLGFDIAALGALFVATGHAVPVDALVLGYMIGYLANMLPIPGGFGVLEAGLAGTLIAYGAPATRAAAAVIVYHAIAFWIPSLGGLIGYASLRRRTALQDPQALHDPQALQEPQEMMTG